MAGGSDWSESSPWWWTLVAIAAVLTVFAGWDVRLLRWGVVVGPVGFLLSLFWFLPFYANSTYMNDMGWEKYTRYTDYLLADPSSIPVACRTATWCSRSRGSASC